METIFDHNITQDEIENFFGAHFRTKEEYDLINSTVVPGIIEPMTEYDMQQDEYVGIYKLYKYRGDEAKAKEYYDKIDDMTYKLGTLGHNDVLPDDYELPDDAVVIGTI